MPKINRNKIEDAKILTEFFLANDSLRHIVLKFLSESIIWANQLKSDNWNLNLDKNGQFIRFNVGHEYCIEIFKDQIIILCLKEVLRLSLGNQQKKIQFKGYENKKEIFSYNLDSVPDCLAKVPDSVACFLEHSQIAECLPLLKNANTKFIEYAILHTTQLPVMRDAHSLGYIDYLSQLGLLVEPTLSEDNEDINFAEEVPTEQAENLIEGAKKTITVNIYERNAKARTECIKYWGIDCKVCGLNFEREYGDYGKGFIHVHHLTKISDIGMEYQIDPIKDLRPVCPNCHSMLHKSNPPLTIEELQEKRSKILRG